MWLTRIAQRYWSFEAVHCIRQNRDARHFDRQDALLHLPEYIRREQPAFEPWFNACLWLLFAIGVGTALATDTFPCALGVLFIVLAINSFVRFRRRRRAFVRYALSHSTDRLDMCRRCRYDLRGATGERCPECGAPAYFGNAGGTKGREGPG